MDELTRYRELYKPALGRVSLSLFKHNNTYTSSVDAERSGKQGRPDSEEHNERSDVAEEPRQTGISR